MRPAVPCLPAAAHLAPAEAARRLGVSTKALRVYEQRGLVSPARTAAGWRVYGPDEMARAAEVVALRALDLSLAQVAQVLQGDAGQLEAALAAHQDGLEAQARALAGTLDRIRRWRRDLAQGRAPATGDLARLLAPPSAPGIAFDLPWPWGGERFELHQIRPLTFVTGPLGSGKTRLARTLAEALPGGAFLGLERAADGGAAARARLAGDPALAARVDAALAWLTGEGAAPSDALRALLCGLEDEGPGALVVDMVEQGLDRGSQEALAAHLQRRRSRSRPLFLLTRSSAILDLASICPDAAILLCPANHSPPVLVEPRPGAPGYEAVATCLAPPEVRARTEGVIAWRPPLTPPGSR